jgi:outer membrane biogenesis lipoprotein LolB
MKHAIQIIAILLVIMLLTGCTTNTTNTTNPTDSTSQITDNLVDTVKNDFRGDAAGDWVMRRQYSVGTFSDDGYYYTSPEGFLYFYQKHFHC